MLLRLPAFTGSNRAESTQRGHCAIGAVPSGPGWRVANDFAVPGDAMVQYAPPFEKIVWPPQHIRATADFAEQGLSLWANEQIYRLQLDLGKHQSDNDRKRRQKRQSDHTEIQFGRPAK
jgi:hypothetical protein